MFDIGADLKRAYEEGHEDGYQIGTVHGMNACTDEEFKAEAKRRGYNLIKIPEKVKLLPCVCGRRRLVLWWGNHGESYACPICGSEGESGKNNRQARLNWNKMIEEKMKDATD